jgi:hypothetical protein
MAGFLPCGATLGSFLSPSTSSSHKVCLFADLVRILGMMLRLPCVGRSMAVAPKTALFVCQLQLAATKAANPGGPVLLHNAMPHIETRRVSILFTG